MRFEIPVVLTLLSAIANGAAVPAELSRRQGQAPAAGTVIQRCTKPGVIALTYDDGPGQYGTQLLNILKQNNVTATFFVTGTLYGCIHQRAAQLKSYYDAGHQIGSHTWTHANQQNMGAQQVRTEMSRLEGAFNQILGVKPKYMRPPNGAVGSQMQQVQREMDYRLVNWDVDSADWNNQSPQSALQKLQQAGAGGNGHIILMHETVAATVNQLTQMVINWAKQNNLRPVTVAECVGDDTWPYTNGTAQKTTNC